MLTLTHEQEQVVDLMANEPTRAALQGSLTGTGKTVCSIELAKRVGAKTILVIAPLGTFDGWTATLKSQWPDMPVHQITSKTPKNFDRLKSGEPGMYLIGREFFTLSGSDQPDKKDANGQVVKEGTRKARWSWKTVTPDIAIADECFKAGTLISTPSGDVPIETLRTGDSVLGYDHVSNEVIVTTVRGTMNKRVGGVMPNGATPNHPYYVKGKGYYPLADTTEDDFFERLTDDRKNVRKVRNTLFDEEQGAEVLLQRVPTYQTQKPSAGEGVPPVWAGLQPLSQQPPTGVLQPGVFKQVSRYAQGGGHRISTMVENSRGVRSQVRIIPATVGETGSTGGPIPEDVGKQSQRPTGGDGENNGDEGVKGCNLRAPKWWERAENTLRSLLTRHARGGLGRTARGAYGEESGVWISTGVQTGPSPAGNKVERGVRRTEPQFSNSAEKGPETGRPVDRTGLDYLAVQEPRDSERYRQMYSRYSSSGETVVYNIETGTNNYFADRVLVHNCQFASSRKSSSSKVLRHLKAGYKVAVSATPQGNKFEGLWAVTRWLWPDLVDKSFWRWSATWAEVEFCPHAGKKVTGEKTPGAFVNSLPCYVRILKDEVPTTVRNIYLDMTPAQAKMYRQMTDDALAWLQDHPLVADYPMTKHIRLRQMALGEVTIEYTGEFDDDGAPEYDVLFDPHCASPKIDAMVKIKELHKGEPIMFLTDSAKFARVAADRLGEGAVSWTGDNDHVTRNDYKARFGKDITAIVATIPSISEGVDGLQRVCSTEVWVSKSLNNMQNIQASGRLNRTGQVSEEIVSYNLITRNSGDDGTLERLLKNAEDNRKTLEAAL